ncbi:MAG: adenylate kinase [Rickettsiales bacterium]|nr:MAG: adenylate kinase [Rickettsiales bacterium]
MKKELIIFLGSPGSGKGTQANMLKEEFDYYPLSTGQLLRDEGKKDTEEAKEINRLINAGLLVSDELILDIAFKEIEKVENQTIILDGYPRTLKQAELAQQIIDKNLDKFILKKVFIFDLEETALIYRIRNRVTCDKCGKVYNLITKKPEKVGVCDACGGKLMNRVDDSEIDSILKRNRIYKTNIPDIISFYEKNNLTFLIDSVKDLKSINQEIKNVLKITNNKSEV